MVSEECCCLTKNCQQLSVELFQRQQLHIENRHPNPSSYKQQVFKDQSKDLKKARFICFGISNPSVSNASPQPLKKKRFNYPSNESSSKIVHSKWRVSAPTEDSLDLEVNYFHSTRLIIKKKILTSVFSVVERRRFFYESHKRRWRGRDLMICYVVQQQLLGSFSFIC